MPDSLWLHGLQHAWLLCPPLSPRVCSNSCPFSQWCHPTISSSVIPFSSCPPYFPASGSLQWVGFLHQVAKVLELQLQHQSFQWIFRVDFLQDWLVGSPCRPRDSQESSPAPQFKSINSSALSLLHGPTLTCIHDYWKNHSFDYALPGWLKFKQLRTANVRKYVEQLELPFITCGNTMWNSQFEGKFGIFLQNQAYTYYMTQQLCSLVFTQTCWKHVHTKTSTQMFTAALFIISLTWKQVRCPSVSVCINKLWSTQTNEYSVQLLSCVWLFAIPWTTAGQASLSITNSLTLLKLMSIKSVMPSIHLILCHPLLLLPSIFPNIRVFSNESILHIMWSKLSELQLQHQSFQWIFRTDFL